MKLIKPAAIQDAVLVASNVVETAPAAYSSGVTYGLGATVSVFSGTTAAVYTSRAAGNLANTPGSSPNWWTLTGTTYATYSPSITYAKDDKVKSVLLNPALLCVIAIFICVGGLFGATDVSTIAFADEQGQKSQAGIILGIFALGSGISGLGYGARQWASPLWKRFIIGIVGLAVGVSLFLFATSIWVLAGVMFVTGFAISPTLINGNNLVQLVVSPRQLTEGLTWVGTALGAGVAMGSALGGAQIDRFGAHAGFYIVMYAAAISVVVALIAIPSLRKRTATQPHSITEVDVSGEPEPS